MMLLLSAAITAAFLAVAAGSFTFLGDLLASRNRDGQIEYSSQSIQRWCSKMRADGNLLGILDLFVNMSEYLCVFTPHISPDFP